MKTNSRFFLRTFAFLTTLSLSVLSTAALVKSTDRQNGCTLYRVKAENEQMLANEQMVIDRVVNGLLIDNMEIDFLQKRVLVDVIVSMPFWFNGPFISNSRVYISGNSSQLNFLINQLNRKFTVLEKMCISDKNELVYASLFPVPVSK